MLTERNRGVLFLAVCALGISALVTQLTLMRELVSVFSGNELVFGIVLGNWLLLTGFGAYLGKAAPRLKQPIVVLIVAQIVVAVTPIAAVFLLRTLRDEVYVRGAALGPSETVVGCLVLLAPYCLVAGFLLTLASLILASRRGPASIGRVYFLDNLGDVVGGLLFSFVLVYLFDHFRILYVPAFLNLAFACLVALRFGRRKLFGAAMVVTVLLVALAVSCDLDDLSTRIQHPEEKILYRGNSPYGRLIVTESSGQYNFHHNGVILFSAQHAADTEETVGYTDRQVEETVHYAMAQRPDARRVLLISGGVSGTAQEVLKYWDQSDLEEEVGLDYVELDPLIIDVAQRYLPGSLADARGRIRVFATDGRLFVKQAAGTYDYDVVIVDVPDPSTSQINRFYTREFFEQVGRRLAADGVVSISLSHYENYLSDELANLIAVAHQTLRKEFQNVLIVPAGRIYFLASDGPLTTEVAARIEDKGVQTQWMTPHYVSDVLRPLRLEGVRRAISDEAAVNEDFSPILYYHHLRYWVSRFKVRLGLVEGALLLLLVVCLFRIRPVSFALFTTGLAASALEIVLLVGFQILYGCVYHQVGWIVTMFMVGLGIGSFTMNRILAGRTRKDLAALEFAVAAYAACLPLVLVGLGRLGNQVALGVASQMAIPFLALVLGVLVGLEFPLAGKVDFRTVSSTAARLYTADYLGAAVGALVASTLLIPVMGVMTVCLLVAGLNVASGAVMLWTSRG